MPFSFTVIINLPSAVSMIGAKYIFLAQAANIRFLSTRINQVFL